MAANGKLPGRQLARVAPGPGQLLRKDAARAYRALDRYCRSVGAGGLSNSGDGALYRPLGEPGDMARGGKFTQWYAWERYKAGGNLAAVPGTSNHGWGVAVDFTSIDAVARHGHAFGWRKTEAFSEPWHYCFVAGHHPLVERWSQAQKGDELQPGDRGPGVKAAKRNLKRHGFWRWPGMSLKYGRRFRRAVVRFQRSRNLTPDGIVGPLTWKHLTAPRRKDRKKKP